MKLYVREGWLTGFVTGAFIVAATTLMSEKHWVPATVFMVLSLGIMALELYVANSDAGRP